MQVQAVGGLFDSHAALHHAMQHLAQNGYLQYSYSIVGTAGSPPVPSNGHNQGLMRALSRLGLEGAQADFYIKGIERGGMLLVLHGVETQRLADVQRMLALQGAQFAR